MADLKISQLTAASTPLAGTEVVPIVQSGVTKKVPVSDLTAGRAISASQVTVSAGNVVIGTAGNGIDFSASSHAPGMTSELLNDYEEGTWTGTFTSATPPTNPPTATGRYTKIGRLVNVYIEFVNVNTTGGAGAMLVDGLPFASASSASYTAVGSVGKFQLGTSASVSVIDTTNLTGMYIVNAENTSTSQMVAGTGRYLFVSLSYMV